MNNFLSRIKTILFLLLISGQYNGQAPTLQWVKQLGGSSIDESFGIATDGSGNVFITGAFSGTADFDPGPGVYNLTSAGDMDIFIAKLDAFGNFVWAKRIGGINEDVGRAIKVDAAGNVFTTGHFSNLVDFDPGPGTYTLSSPGPLADLNIFVLKLTASGNFVMALSMGGSQNQSGNSLDLDASGNIYVTGYFYGVADFNPGLGTYTMATIGNGSFDGFILKLNASGGFQWAKQFGGYQADIGLTVSVNGSGYVYIGGYFTSTAYFDPFLSGAQKIALGLNEGYVCKFDPSGNFLWVKTFPATGISACHSFALDGFENIYVTGDFHGTADFDTGAGTYTLVSGTSTNPYITKLDSSGSLIWAKGLIGPNSSSQGRSIALDAFNNVYTIGLFSSSIDFDPGPGTDIGIATSSSYDVYIHKLSAAGNYNWVITRGSFGPDVGTSITVDQLGKIYTTGGFSGSVYFGPGPGATTLNLFGVQDVFVEKYNQCGGIAPTLSITGTPTICAGGSATLIASGAASYGWSGGLTGSMIVVNPTLTTTYSVEGTNLAGCSAVSPVVVTVMPRPNIFVSSGSVCTGQSYTINASGANTYTYSSGTSVITPTANTSVTVTGTSLAGCINSVGAISTITLNPLPVITVNSGTICSGQVFTINPTGALTYTYSSGSSTVSPATTSVYTITGTSSLGCSPASVAISNVTVYALPIISVNSGSICQGQSFILSPTGAYSYTFSGGSATVSPTTTSSYTVTSTSLQGCVSTQGGTAQVMVSPLPTVSITNANTHVCEGDEIELIANGALSYTWSTGTNGPMSTVTPTATSNYTVMGTNMYGCSNTASVEITVDPCTAVIEFDEENARGRIFPNPASGNCYITSTEEVVLTITNNLGQPIAVIKLCVGINKLDVSEYQNGVYFLVFSNQNTWKALKLLKN